MMIPVLFSHCPYSARVVFIPMLATIGTIVWEVQEVQWTRSRFFSRGIENIKVTEF